MVFTKIVMAQVQRKRGFSCWPTLGLFTFTAASIAAIVYGVRRGDRIGTLISVTGTGVLATGATFIIVTAAGLLMIIGAGYAGLILFGLAIFNRSSPAPKDKRY